ncbi:TrbI/VirB10 family protein [Jonquetella anthropi]|uniref:TrbI/VirB10 family protein n=1 Tax=Jonquetella anthropi TaxID=428712 RepID=UPI0023F4CC2A|nr:TrbI/VirB10 family protein [Jonquetella anthropi]
MGPSAFNHNEYQEKQPLSKRIRYVIIFGIMILFAAVAVAISMSKGHFRAADAPTAVKATTATPPEPSKVPSNVEAPAQNKAVEEAKEEPPQVQAPQVIYYQVPAPRVGNYRKNAYTVRLASAGTASTISTFGSNGQSGNGGGQAQQANPGDLTNLLAGLGGENPAAAWGRGNAPDPNGWNRKAEFMKQGLPEDYSPYLPQAPVTPYELKAGSVIPCVLISGLNSDLPGNIVAQVSEDVYDTATGRILLIPRGSRVVGAYDSQISYGQSRVLVVWQRLLYPNGVSVKIDNMGATDQSGYTGLKGGVNRHWNSVITSALMVSLLGAGVDIIAPKTKDDNRDETDPKSKVLENAAASVADAMSQIIKREVDRQPTIKVKPGYRCTIFVKQDMTLIPCGR